MHVYVVGTLLGGEDTSESEYEGGGGKMNILLPLHKKQSKSNSGRKLITIMSDPLCCWLIHVISIAIK